MHERPWRTPQDRLAATHHGSLQEVRLLVQKGKTNKDKKVNVENETGGGVLYVCGSMWDIAVC